VEQEVTLTVNGQEVQTADLNLIAEAAAHGSDWLFAELLRPSTPSGSTPYKYIIPAGSRREIPFGGGAGDVNRRPLIGVSGSANAKIRIAPFTAIVASNVPVATNVKKAIRNIRTVGHYGDDTANTPYTDLQLSVTTDYRWDLIYAKVDIDVSDGLVARFVKSGAGAATSTNLAVTKQTLLTLGVVAGVEGGTPTRPVLPSDSATTFYFALGYIYRNASETLTTLLAALNIHESFDSITMSPAVGGSDVRPANGTHRVAGSTIVNELWGASNSRPKTHMPASMVGKVERLIPIHNTLLDNSIDWRRRVFKTTVNGTMGASINDGFPWTVAPPNSNVATWGSANGRVVGGGGGATDLVVANSFLEDMNAIAGGAIFGSVIVYLEAALLIPNLSVGAKLVVYVDATSGDLLCWRNNADANRYIMLWLEASAPYPNTDADGL
jgi:hypothetical protein